MEKDDLIFCISVWGSLAAVGEELPALIAEMLLTLNEDWRRDMLRPVYTMRSIHSASRQHLYRPVEYSLVRLLIVCVVDGWLVIRQHHHIWVSNLICLDVAECV